MDAESNYLYLALSFIMLTSSCSAIDQAARLHNSHITSQGTTLHSLRDQRNTITDGFPMNTSELMRLTD